MIKVALTRYREKQGRLLHRTTSSESQSKIVVVLEGNQGRYVVQYDEIVGLEITTSDDVTLMRDDLVLTDPAVRIPRYRAEKT
jgi:hypothetical protein